MDKLKQLINLQEKRHWLIAGGIAVFTLVVIIYAVFKDNTVKERSESQLIDELYGKIGKLNIELGWLKKIRTVLQRLNVGLLIAGIQD